MGLYRKLTTLIFCCCSTLGFCQSVYLYNDSPFKLDAVVVDATGATRGQITMDPAQQTNLYLPTPNFQQPQTPTVPYTVIWYCQDQTQYGIWTNATSGSLVTAQGSTGQKICKFKKPQNNSSTNTND